MEEIDSKVGSRSGFGTRFAGALRLDAAAYEEIEHSPNALGQALGVVALSSVANGLGSMGETGAAAFVPGVLVALFGWVIWAGLVYVIGTKILPEPQTRSDVPELMRVTGFAASPGIFGLLGLVPLLGPLLFVAVSFWMLLAMLVAVRQALDFSSTWRALAVVSIGWAVYIVLILVVASLNTPA